MSECSACGARVSPGEHFCGNCGMQLSPSSPELETLSATLGDEDEVHSTKSSAFAETLDDEITDQPPITAEPLMTAEPAVEDEVGETSLAPISSASLGGSFTDSVHPPASAPLPKESTTGGHRPSVKQLPANTVLN